MAQSGFPPNGDVQVSVPASDKCILIFGRVESITAAPETGEDGALIMPRGRAKLCAKRALIVVDLPNSLIGGLPLWKAVQLDGKSGKLS